MVRFSSLIAAAISFISVLADQPDVAYYASIDPSDTSVDGGGDIIYIDVPVSLNLLDGAPTGSYSLTVTVAPYRIVNESYAGDVDPTVVYTGTIQGGSVVNVALEVAKEKWTDFIIQAEVQSDEDEVIVGEAGNTIIAPNEFGNWEAIDIDEWIDRINTELIKELEEREIEGTDEPPDVDAGEVPVRVNPDPAPIEPKDDGPPRGNGTVTGPITTTTKPPGGGDGSVTGPGGSDGGSVTRPGGSDGGSTTRPGGGDNGGKSTTCKGCGHGDGPRTLITIRKTTTVCPTPTPPPPPPCPENEKELHARLAERQAAPINKAYVNAKIQYRNKEKKLLPVRGLFIEAEVEVYRGTTFSRKRTSSIWTNLRGEGTFTFSIREGERLEVNRLTTTLKRDGRWLIGTTKNQRSFTTRLLEFRLNVNPWLVEAGETKSYTVSHPFSDYWQALWVADAIKVVTDYAASKIFIQGEQSLLNIWFPSKMKPGTEGILAGAFFRGQGANSFISLPQKDASRPSTLGHEYGHFVHFTSRSGRNLAGSSPKPHFSCNPSEPNPSNELSFKEGFATAFGLAALDQSHLEDGYLAKTASNGKAVSYEDFKCADQILLNNEGRVGAALLDLVDRKLDTFLADTSPTGFIRPGFKGQDLNIKFDPRFIFYELMRYPPFRALPDNMKFYW